MRPIDERSFKYERKDRWKGIHWIKHAVQYAGLSCVVAFVGCSSLDTHSHHIHLPLSWWTAVFGVSTVNRPFTSPITSLHCLVTPSPARLISSEALIFYAGHRHTKGQSILFLNATSSSSTTPGRITSTEQGQSIRLNQKKFSKNQRQLSLPYPHPHPHALDVASSPTLGRT